MAFPRAAQVLARGGFLALATNAHVLGGTQDEIATEIQRLHHRIAPDVGPWEFPTAEAVAARAAAGGDIAAVWSRVDRCFFEPPDVSHLFREPIVTAYEWIAEYDIDGYLAMLGTQSTYLLMANDQRGALRSTRVPDPRPSQWQGHQGTSGGPWRPHRGIAARGVRGRPPQALARTR